MVPVLDGFTMTVLVLRRSRWRVDLFELFNQEYLPVQCKPFNTFQALASIINDCISMDVGVLHWWKLLFGYTAFSYQSLTHLVMIHLVLLLPLL